MRTLPRIPTHAQLSAPRSRSVHLPPRQPFRFPNPPGPGKYELRPPVAQKLPGKKKKYSRAKIEAARKRAEERAKQRDARQAMLAAKAAKRKMRRAKSAYL